NGVANHLVGELANGFADQFLGFLALGSGHDAGHAGGGGRFYVEDDAAFNVAHNFDHGGDALAVVSAGLHGKVAEAGLAVQVLSQNGVGGIDERLDEFHFHVQDPWVAPLATTHSSPITYLMTS